MIMTSSSVSSTMYMSDKTRSLPPVLLKCHGKIRKNRTYDSKTGNFKQQLLILINAACDLLFDHCPSICPALSRLPFINACKISLKDMEDLTVIASETAFLYPKNLPACPGKVLPDPLLLSDLLHSGCLFLSDLSSWPPSFSLPWLPALFLSVRR